jgi:hypothetical protein
VDRYEDERRRKADELIAMIRELREPLPQPTPLVYRPEEPPDDEPATRVTRYAGRVPVTFNRRAGPGMLHDADDLTRS